MLFCAVAVSGYGLLAGMGAQAVLAVLNVVFFRC